MSAPYMVLGVIIFIKLQRAVSAAEKGFPRGIILLGEAKNMFPWASLVTDPCCGVCLCLSVCLWE